MLKERIKQYYSVLKFRPYNNNYYNSLASLNEALNCLKESNMYDYFVDKYFDKVDNCTVKPKSIDLIKHLKTDINIAMSMFSCMHKDFIIGYSFKSNMIYELNLVLESLSNLEYHYNDSIPRLKYINDIIDGVYDNDIDILESIFEGYEYDISEDSLIIKYPEIKIEEEEGVNNVKKNKGVNIIKDTYLFIKLDMKSLKKDIGLMIMKPSYNQVVESKGFPHVNGGIRHPTYNFCFGSTPPEISSKSNYINNIIKIILYFDVYLRKKFTNSVYNNLINNKYIDLFNRKTVEQKIPNNIKVYKRRFQGAYILDYDIDFGDNTISIDDLGMISLNTESKSYNLSEFTFLFKGKHIRQQFDDNKIIDNQQIQSIIKNKIYATKQSKLLALYSFKKTIEKLVEGEHHRGSGEEDQNTMYEDTISRMGRVNTVALFRGRWK